MIGDYALLLRQKGFTEKLGIRISGRGTRTFVLANGFGTDSTVWDSMIGFFEERGRVVRFDWPVAPEHYDVTRYSRLDAYAEDLLAVITYASAAPAFLVGHSVSGMIGMLAGQHAPRMFERMVMIAPSPCYRRSPDYDARLDAAEVRDLLAGMAANYSAWVQNFAPIAVGRNAGDEGLAHFTRGLLAMRPDVALAMAMTIWNCDLRDRLDGFSVPTTIVQPDEDPAVPVSVAHYLASKWQRADVRVVPADGHLPHLTHPGIIRAALQDILGRAEPVAAQVGS